VSPDPLSSADRDAVAREVLAALDHDAQIPLVTDRVRGLDEAAAYDVYQRVHAARVARGARPVGRKIGFTNPVTWAAFNVGAPAWAHVYDRTVTHLPASRGTCRLGALIEPRIEPEIVLHFGAPPRAGVGPEALLACVDWVAHGFEIVVSLYPKWTLTGPDAIASGSCHARLLVGAPRPVAALGPDLIARLERFTVTLARDGEVRERGGGANVLGSPLAAMGHLLALLARQPGAAPLETGDLVTTGTLTAPPLIRPGETWSTRLDGLDLPGLEVTFAA
jgi:2-oxo-3-hexenedioate decarboxylase